MESLLSIVEKRLEQLLNEHGNEKYFLIPSLWLNPYIDSIEKAVWVSPYQFYLERIAKLKELSMKNPVKLQAQGWTKEAVVYNMFVRYATAFDHNGDGIININDDFKGFRETGTFLKTIALLPYIHYLGANTIYILPITSIGIDGRKGTLGSPYAIKNPYKLDENLSEPALELEIEKEFGAFVEAAHLLGMKVVLEFVFRTASIDSDLAFEHPEWFYWIKDQIQNRDYGANDASKYGPPVFTNQELEKIKEKVAKNDFEDLPEPTDTFKNFFTKPPKLVTRANHKIMGIGTGKEECKIPCAFADWPPDDNQPVWSDVTYLKLYDHPDFNYIAYNTVRMYDTRLAIDKYKLNDLWESICGIVPYYQRNFNIDGVMIDMGHALPSELRSEIVSRAKEVNSNFTFWEENFTLTQKSVDDGYDVVVGYLPFDLHLSLKVKEFINLLSTKGIPVPYFGTPENHNTPRASSRIGGTEFAKFTWTIINLIPCVPFIHAGFELGCKLPVNTGLGFTLDEIKSYPAEKLPLFSEGSLNWDSTDEWIEYLRFMSELRKRLIKSNDFEQGNVIELKNSSDYIISFIRKIEVGNNLMFLGNMHPDKEIYFCVKLPKKLNLFIDMFSDKFFRIVNDELILNLKPFEMFLGEIS